MSELFPVFPNDVVQQVKLSLKLPEVINAIVTRQIVAAVCNRSGIQVDPAELQQAADAFRLQHNLSSAEDTIAWLQKYCLTIEDFEALIYSETLQARLARHLFDHQIEPHFSEHLSDYVQAVLYKIDLPDLNTAKSLYQAIQADQMKFTQAVQQHSQNQDPRRWDGYYGIFTRPQLPPELAEIVFLAQPPEVLKPTSKSLIYVERLLQPQLTPALRERILAELFANWTAQQLDRAEIRLEL